jgi:hydroxymethylpyrimidine pyrophosphatase-like HAD family hydrolase
MPHRCRLLATDYDGTLARRGTMADGTRAALGRLRASGRRIVMVTGRVIDDLQRVCPDLSPFDLVVAENGGVIYAPATGDRRVLAPAPPPALVQHLRSRGVPEVMPGEVVVGLKRIHLGAAEEVIDELALDLALVFNVDAVMILPPGVTKGTGIEAALATLGVSPDETVGIGDGENDFALLAACGLGAAVANAVPDLKAQADLVMRGEDGDGVTELADRILRDELPPPLVAG